MSPDGRTVLFGLPGVGVRHVERVMSHPVVGSGEHCGAGGPRGDGGPGSCVLPGVWRRVDVGAAAPDDVPKRPAIR